MRDEESMTLDRVQDSLPLKSECLPKLPKPSNLVLKQNKKRPTTSRYEINP